MIAVKRVLRYLVGTKDWKLRVGGSGSDISYYVNSDCPGENNSCFVDADYAGDPDDFRSTSGLCVVFGGVIDWRSRKQKSTAPSTTDAEYYAFGMGCMRMTQIIQLLNKFGLENALQKPVIYTDSQSMLSSVKGRIYRGTAVAHIATKFYLGADMVTDGEVRLEYIPSEKMLADGFTKALPKPAFLKLCSMMGLVGKGLRAYKLGLDMPLVYPPASIEGTANAIASYQ